MNFAASITTADAIAKLLSYRQIAKLGPTTNIAASDKMFILPSACHDEVLPSVMPLDISFLDVIDFCAEIYQRINDPPASYVAVHLRCGDLHMECAKGFAGPTTDSRKWNERALFHQIEELHQQGKKIENIKNSLQSNTHICK